MNKYSWIIFLFISISAFSQADDPIIYRCPPCSSPCDTIIFDKKGICPVCNMAVYATYKSLPNTHNMHNNSGFSSKSVAILIYPGVEIIDFTGPWEVFGQAGMSIFTVAETTNPLRTAMNMNITPDYSFENMPKADIVLVPGGNSDHQDKKILDWLVKADKQSSITMSVCDGAYFLALAGLLDGKEATTLASLVPGLKKAAPKAKVSTTKRFTHDGKIVTSAGLSSGIDAALHVVAEELGMGRTRQIATHLEYNWDTEGKYVRAQLADKYLQGIRSILSQFDPKTMLYEGSEDHWKYQAQISTMLGEEKIHKLIGFQIENAVDGKPAGKNMYEVKSDTGKIGQVSVKIEKQPENKKLVTLEVVSKKYQSVTFSSFTKADSIIHKALKAHGGLEKIKAIKNITLDYEGMRYMINQSRLAYPPWDNEPSVGKVVVDLEKNKMYSFGSNSFPGIGAFAGVHVVIEKEGFHYDPAKNYMGNEIMKLTGDGIHWPWNYSKRWLPPLLLLQMYENRTQLRYLGSFIKNGLELHVINYIQPKGNMMSVYFDAKTYYLRGFELIRDDGVYGDLSDEGIYDDYKDFNGVVLPVKRIDYFNNVVARELAMNISVDAGIDTSLFAYPVGYVEAKDNPNYQRIIKVGDGVYIDQDMGGVLFVEFDNYVAVLDCPENFSMSWSTIQEIRKTIPGKKIKYVIPSHTHGDHGGGARAYYYIGATLLTTPGHAPFYQSLSNIKQTISPDSLSLSPKEPLIETFTNKKIITDGHQTIELYNAGPNAHSQELTFAYLPKQKIIWQVDMFFVPATGNGINKAMPVTIAFAKKLKDLKIDNFKYIIDGHNSRMITRDQFAASLLMGGYKF
jgi:putative intracellular protease/amidase/glyoxylase-like metal-dependent hydrolase (beta-lactamase superfamily II)